MPKLILFISFLFFSVTINSQSRKFYTIKDDNTYDKIVFRVKAETGKYKIIPSKRPNVIDIFGSPNHDNLNPSFTSKKLEQRVRSVNFTVENLYDPILHNLLWKKKKKLPIRELIQLLQNKVSPLTKN